MNDSINNMKSINWNYQTPIWFGLNRSKEIQVACDELNILNPLIVTDPGILKTKIISKINNYLNIEAKIFSNVQSNPTGENVMNGVEQFKKIQDNPDNKTENLST